MPPSNDSLAANVETLSHSHVEGKGKENEVSLPKTECQTPSMFSANYFTYFPYGYSHYFCMCGMSEWRLGD